MRQVLNRLLLLFSIFGILGCTHSLHLAHVSDFAPTYASYNKGELVKARAEQFVVLGFVTDTDYVNQAHNQLLSACPQGIVQGIVTEFYTSHGFLSWTNYVDIQGLCVQSKKN